MKAVTKPFPYREITINLLVLLVIGAFSVLTPNMGSKEILSVIVVLSVFYIHTFLLSPVLLAQQKKIKYGLGLVVLSAGFYWLIGKIIRNLFADVQTGEDAFYRVFALTAALLATLFFSFLYAYFRQVKARERSFDLQLGNKESELQLLKSQVNPHFLFNALNALYATALVENAPKTSESIAKLASLIRYMQQDIQKAFIPLQNEVRYLQDYVAIQKIRAAVAPQVELRFENCEHYRISPGLLIPFVENAFKYGIDPSKPSQLTVSVRCGEDCITFDCINTYHENYKAFNKEEGFGIGIKNVQQRLALVYPGRHTLAINRHQGTFSVKLVINTAGK